MIITEKMLDLAGVELNERQQLNEIAGETMITLSTWEALKLGFIGYFGAAAAELAVTTAVVGIPLLYHAAKVGFPIAAEKIRKFIERRKEIEAIAAAGGEEKAMAELQKLNREIHAALMDVLPQGEKRGKLLALLNRMQPMKNDYSYTEMKQAVEKAKKVLENPED